MSDTNDNPAPSRPRRKRKSYALLILAAGILLFGVAAGTLYYVLAADDAAHCRRASRQRRPETGPADGADFCARRQPGAAVADHDRRSGREHRAVQRRQDRSCGGARRSEPACQCRLGRHPAQECRRAVGAVRASDKGLEEAADAEDQDARRPRGTSRRRDRTDAGQCHAAARHPEGVRHQSRQGRGQPVRHQPDLPRWRAIRRSTRS